MIMKSEEPVLIVGKKLKNRRNAVFFKVNEIEAELNGGREVKCLYTESSEFGAQREFSLFFSVYPLHVHIKEVHFVARNMLSGQLHSCSLGSGVSVGVVGEKGLDLPGVGVGEGAWLLEDEKTFLSCRLELTETEWKLERVELELTVILLPQAVIARLAEELHRLRALAWIQKEQLEQYQHSWSWKSTLPFRIIGECFRQLYRHTLEWKAILLRKKQQMKLMAQNDLDMFEEDRWHIAGVDPQFYLQGLFPIGWVRCSWGGRAEMELPFRLYFDLGMGWQEEHSVLLGSLRENGETQSAYLFIPPQTKALRLDPEGTRQEFVFESFSFVAVSRLELLWQAVQAFQERFAAVGNPLSALLVKAYQVFRTQGVKEVWRKAKNLVVAGGVATSTEEYKLWQRLHSLSEEEIALRKKQVETLPYKPLISIVVPVYNVDEIWLRKCIESVRAQIYPRWELCIADDCSPKQHVQKVLREYEALDSRIKVVYRQENGHISRSSNSALALAKGEYIALLDHDDELTVDALYENVLLLNKHPEADMIYSDEDKIGEDGVCYSPFLKPDWSPDLFLSQMYTCHFGVYRASLIRKIGGFRVGYEGSQDYDLVLRFTEQTKHIFHIPKILYHWRTIAESTALNSSSKGYAYVAGLKALQSALERRGEAGWVEPVENFPGQYRVHFLVQGRPLVSILIPTRDMAQVLAPCLQSLFAVTEYERYEVILIDNGSKQEDTKQLLKYWREKEPERFRVLELDTPFNYSRLNNEAAKAAKGEYLVLLNNDIRILSSNWLEEMLGQAQRASVGAVGARLLYPNRTIQHAGVTLGIVGPANHGHRGVEATSPGYFGRLLVTANYAAVTGACLLVSKNKYESVGGLDESLSIAFNDIDFCLKLWKQGWYNLVLNHIEFIHDESRSRGKDTTPEKQKRLQEEAALMNERWGSLLYNDPFYNVNLTLDREDFSLRFPKV